MLFTNINSLKYIIIYYNIPDAPDDLQIWDWIYNYFKIVYHLSKKNCTKWRGGQLHVPTYF